jgi:iron complex transport system substrate-binding protein
MLSIEEDIKWMLCLLAIFALAIPLAVAAEPSGDDLLNIFGNANMDDKIDEADIAYVEDIISGINEPTKFADANYDGEIDSQDIDKINEIIRGEEKELTVADSIGRNVTINMPVEYLIALGSYRNEAVKILDAEDKMVGVSSDIKDLNLLLSGTGRQARRRNVVCT